MTKLKTIVSLDYDGTITRDPDMWLDVLRAMQAHGHEVHIVTMRYDTESTMGGDTMDERFLNEANGVHFTGNHETEERHAKKPHMDAKGIKVHVWIDDNPRAVHENASQIWGYSSPAGQVVVAGRPTPEPDAMRSVLERARDAIEALDGTSIENEKLVDDYRALMGEPPCL